MLEFVKIALVIAGYLFVAPLMGILTSRSRFVERFCMSAIILMTALRPDYFSLTIYSTDLYKGHTRGYEFSLIEVLAIIIISANLWRRERTVRLLPPGAKAYLVYCAVASVSSLLLVLPITLPAFLVSLEDGGAWINASYVRMAVLKFPKFLLILIATHSFIHTKKDILYIFNSVAVVLAVAMVIALKHRYIDAHYQVRGGFEHQNQLGMWTYLWSLPLLAIAVSPGTGWRTSLWMLVGYGAGAVIVVLTVSRGAVAVFGGGSIAILMVLQIRNFSWKSLVVVVGFLVIAGGVGIKAYDSIVERFVKWDDIGTHDLRDNLVDQAQAMLADSAIGVGWNNFPVAASRPVEKYSRIREEWDISRGQRFSESYYRSNGLVENYYWCILAETGFLAFIAFVCFCIYTVFLAARNSWRLRDSWVGYLLMAMAIVLTALYLHSTLERVLAQAKSAATWMILLGIVARLETARRRRSRVAEGTVA